MRLLPWLVLIALVIWALRKSIRGAGMRSNSRSNSRSTAQNTPRPESMPNDHTNQTAPADTPAEAMVSCAHCQLYFPLSEAVHRKDQLFCSTAHADLH